MQLRNAIGIGLLLFNLPWVVLWLVFTGGNVDRELGVPALFALLTLATIGMIVLPLCVGAIHRKRWLLILALGLVNIFWGLRWIEVYSRFAPGDPRYPLQRLGLLLVMAGSSAGILLGYWLLDRGLLTRRTPPGD